MKDFNLKWLKLYKQYISVGAYVALVKPALHVVSQTSFRGPPSGEASPSHGARPLGGKAGPLNQPLSNRSEGLS